MLINLPETLERSIRLVVDDGQFASVDDAMTEAARLLLRHLKQGPQERVVEGETSSPRHKPIWEEIAEISARVSDEAWDDLPTDLSAQHDHYIYGTPKRNEE